MLAKNIHTDILIQCSIIAWSISRSCRRCANCIYYWQYHTTHAYQISLKLVT